MGAGPGRLATCELGILEEKLLLELHLLRGITLGEDAAVLNLDLAGIL